uniref:Uncharacterized protein n=1 Tax=Fagus sylvatica TaxID=28930 RepID=A0A2N9GIR4_FAGSY
METTMSMNFNVAHPSTNKIQASYSPRQNLEVRFRCQRGQFVVRGGDILAQDPYAFFVMSPALIPTDALLNIVLFGKDTQQSLKALSRGIAPPRAPGASPIIQDPYAFFVTSPALIPTDALLNIVLFGKDTQQSLKALSRGIAPPRAPGASPMWSKVLHMGDAPGALGGAIPRDKALRDCCVSFPKRTILSSASVGIRAGDVTGPHQDTSAMSPLHRSTPSIA